MSVTKITGIGAVLVDVLINETDAFLNALGKKKGGMTYVDEKEQQEIIKTPDRHLWSFPAEPPVIPSSAWATWEAKPDLSANGAKIALENNLKPRSAPGV